MTQHQYLSDDEREAFAQRKSTIGRLAARRWNDGDPVAAVGGYMLISGANCDVESDQHRSFSWRQVIGYASGTQFVSLQSANCWPTIERMENCWVAGVRAPDAPLSEVKAEPSEALTAEQREGIHDEMVNTHGFKGEDTEHMVDLVIDATASALAARQASPQQGAAQSGVADLRHQIENAIASTGYCSSMHVDTAELADTIARALAASAPTVGGVDRAAIIEECARAVESPAAGLIYVRRKTLEEAAKAVRALAATPSSPAVEEASSAGAVTYQLDDGTDPATARANFARMQRDLSLDDRRALANWVAHGARAELNPDGSVSLTRRDWAKPKILRPSTPAPAPAVPADGEWPTATPQFRYRAEHPHGPNIVDRVTGKWWSIETVREMASLLPAAGEQPVAWMLEGVGVNDSGARSVHLREPKNVDARYWKVVPVYARPSAAGADEGNDAQAKRVIDSARNAMNSSRENDEGDIVVPSWLAAPLSLALDEFDAARAGGVTS